VEGTSRPVELPVRACGRGVPFPVSSIEDAELLGDVLVLMDMTRKSTMVAAAGNSRRLLSTCAMAAAVGSPNVPPPPPARHHLNRSATDATSTPALKKRRPHALRPSSDAI